MGIISIVSEKMFRFYSEKSGPFIIQFIVGIASLLFSSWGHHQRHKMWHDMNIQLQLHKCMS